MGDPRASPFSRPGRRRSPHAVEQRQRGQEAKLRIEGLNARYGAAQILFDVALEVSAGEAVALVGGNGAGKTTALQSVMGMGAIGRTGSIRVDGVETIGMPAHKVARLGVGLAPEGRRAFAALTVQENLLVAASRGTRAGSGSGARTGAAGGGGAGETTSWPLERVYEAFPLLEKVKRSKGAWLSGGEQQVLAIARALVSGPEVLLLDEPSEGLAPRVVETIVEQLLTVRRAGMAMLLAEQHLGLVRALTSRAYVLDRGVIRWEGSTHALLEGGLGQGCRA